MELIAKSSKAFQPDKSMPEILGILKELFAEDLLTVVVMNCEMPKRTFGTGLHKVIVLYDTFNCDFLSFVTFEDFYATPELHFEALLNDLVRSDDLVGIFLPYFQSLKDEEIEVRVVEMLDDLDTFQSIAEVIVALRRWKYPSKKSTAQSGNDFQEKDSAPLELIARLADEHRNKLAFSWQIFRAFRDQVAFTMEDVGKTVLQVSLYPQSV